MNATGPFSQRTAMILAATAGLAFLGYLALYIFGDLLGPGRSAGHHTFSQSAIGHHAFLQTLQRLGLPASIGRRQSGRRVGDNGLLIIAEPSPSTQGGVMAATMTGQVRVALVVLPKRWVPFGERDGDRVTGNGLYSERRIQNLLDRLGMPSVVHRSSSPQRAVRSPWPHLTLDVDNLQTLNAVNLTPVISTKDGVVFGFKNTGSRTIWFLSDPDLIANHGLGRGDNGVLAVRMVEHAYRGGPIVIDETVHGFTLDPSFVRQLFKPPLSAATFAAMAAIAFFLWSAAFRFGPPARRAGELGAGKEGLIENTAHLLDYGGFHASIARRYAMGLVTDAARRLHAPADAVAERRIAFLDRIGKARRTTEQLKTLMADLDRLNERSHAGRHAVMVVANRFYRWRQELIDGAGDNS